MVVKLSIDLGRELLKGNRKHILLVRINHMQSLMPKKLTN